MAATGCGRRITLLTRHPVWLRYVAIPDPPNHNAKAILYTMDRVNNDIDHTVKGSGLLTGWLCNHRTTTGRHKYDLWRLFSDAAHNATPFDVLPVAP